MILDPINSITSISFYKKVAQQAPVRSIVYLAYLALLFSAATLWEVKTQAMPAILETADWLAKTVPPITISGGKLSMTGATPLTVRHPRIAKVAVIIDPSRTEAVTPQLLDKENVLAYVTATALYVEKAPGELEAYDFSKGASGGAKPLVIDAAFYRDASQALARVLYPVAAAAAFILFLGWKLVSSLFYSAVALMLNAIAEAKLDYPPLFNIAVYGQTLSCVIQAMILFSPARVPSFAVLAWLITGLYLWLAIKINASPSPAA